MSSINTYQDEDSSSGILSSSKLPFALIRPAHTPARTELIEVLDTVPTIEELSFLWDGFDWSDADEVMALDLETRGNEAHSPDSYPVMIALADKRGTISFPLSPSLWTSLVTELSKSQIPLIAHNQLFDGAYLQREYVGPINWVACTYALYKMLASEGWLGQRWGLKNAQKEVLLWPETNDIDLVNWLVENGFKNQQGTPQREHMYLAPKDILGKYNALDSEATYLFYKHHLQPLLKRFPEMEELQRKGWMVLNENLITGQLNGMLVNMDGLNRYNESLKDKIRETEQLILTHPKIKPHVDSYSLNVINTEKAKEPSKFVKGTEEVPEEPQKFTKEGAITKRWEKWQEKVAGWKGPVLSQNWLKWNERVKELESSPQFNVNSGKQKQWLFYEALEFPILIYTDNVTNPQPATDHKALSQMGEVGQLFIDHNEYSKEQGYVQAALDLARRSPTGNCIHPQFRSPGTLTSRLSGSGGFNLQQQPKTREYLENFVARPGYVWIEADVAALEPHVLAEVSNDKAMMSLYGPTAKLNDIYLFTGAQLPSFSKEIFAAGYDPFSPTEEGINRAKKECKKIRNIIKTLVLGAQYGAGAKKIWETLTLSGINITLNDVKKIHTDYWNLYAGVKKYGQFLEAQWEKNGGWVINAVGMPQCCDKDKVKDLINRVVQSGGHQILVIWLAILHDELNGRGIPYSPIVWDFHDETIFEVPEEYEQEAVAALNQSVVTLNAVLGGRVKIKAEPKVARSLAEAKLED